MSRRTGEPAWSRKLATSEPITPRAQHPCDAHDNPSAVPRLTLAVVAAISLFCAQCRMARLYHPPPVRFEASDIAAVEQAVLEGMKRLRWIPVKERDGTIRGTLHLRRHIAVVTVTYTSTWYRIQYTDSENLRYRRGYWGEETIHTNYNAWIRNLIREINARLPAMPQRNLVS